MTGASNGFRLPTLDGWRGIAILLVICCHIRWPWAPAENLSVYGALGVHVFFALSGFLITARLLEEYAIEGRVDWRNFYVRRIFRILPPAFACLAVLALLGFVLFLIPLDGRQFSASLFFYRNYLVLPGNLGWYTGHFWSLSVEEHFYLIWPLLLCIFGLRRGIAVASSFAVLIAVWRALDGRFGWVAAAHPLLRGEVVRTDYRLDGLLWGCVAAYVWFDPKWRGYIERFAGTAMLLALVALIAACLIWTPPGHIAVLAVLTSLLPLATLGNPGSLVGRFLDCEPLVWTGRISYSLYLWQQLFLPHASVPIQLPWIQTLPLNLLLAFGTAWLSYRYVEQPAMAFGRRLQHRRRTVRVAIAHA